MIRAATEEDIPAVLVMGRRFFDLAGCPAIAEWDDASFIMTLKNLIESPDGILLVVERSDRLVGMAGALLFPFYFNTSHRTGQEIFWWVEPEARGREALALFAALEEQARDAGAESFIMSNVEAMRSEAVARYYRRRGYRAAENTFIKRF
jgi:GNAT superfamily N-acetyltransferase